MPKALNTNEVAWGVVRATVDECRLVGRSTFECRKKRVMEGDCFFVLDFRCMYNMMRTGVVL